MKMKHAYQLYRVACWLYEIWRWAVDEKIVRDYRHTVIMLGVLAAMALTGLVMPWFQVVVTWYLGYCFVRGVWSHRTNPFHIAGLVLLFGLLVTALRAGEFW